MAAPAAAGGAAAGEAAAVAPESAARGVFKGVCAVCTYVYRCSMRACNFCGAW